MFNPQRIAPLGVVDAAVKRDCFTAWNPDVGACRLRFGLRRTREHDENQSYWLPGHDPSPVRSVQRSNPAPTERATQVGGVAPWWFKRSRPPAESSWSAFVSTCVVPVLRDVTLRAPSVTTLPGGVLDSSLA